MNRSRFLMVLGAWLLVASTAEPTAELLPFEAPDVEHLEPAVAEQLSATASRLQEMQARQDISSAELASAFGSVGQLYHAYELLDAAAVAYANARSLAPDDFRWVYYGAVLEQENGRLEPAVAGLEAALEIDPKSLPAQVRLGEALLGLDRSQDAGRVLEKALDLYPESTAARAALGQVALSEKRYEAAVEALEAVLAAVPAANRLHHPLGLAYRGLGDLDKARLHLRQRGKVGVKAPDPLIEELERLKTGERVFVLRGQTAFRAGRYVEAAAAYQAALEAAPESIAALVGLGSALAQGGQPEKAIPLFRKVIDLQPDNRAAHFNLGVLLAAAGDASAAAEILTAAVELDPKDVGARLELATTLRRLGRPADAAQQAQRAVELEPANEAARMTLASSLIEQQAYSQARQQLEAALTIMPESGRLSAALAKLLAASPDLSLRDGTRALDLATRVYQATGLVQHAEIVALALAENGRCEEAADWQKKAIEATRRAGAEAKTQELTEMLKLFEQRPCRLPGAG